MAAASTLWVFTLQAQLTAKLVYLCACAGVLWGESSWCTPFCTHWTDTDAPASCHQVMPPHWPALTAPGPQSLFCQESATQCVRRSSPGWRNPPCPAQARTAACWWWPSPGLHLRLPAGQSKNWRRIQGWERAPPSCLRPRCWRRSWSLWRPGAGCPDCLLLPWCGGSLGRARLTCPRRRASACSTGPPGSQIWGRKPRRRARSAGTSRAPGMSVWREEHIVVRWRVRRARGSNTRVSLNWKVPGRPQTLAFF